MCMWVVVRIMVPFWVRCRIIIGIRKGTIILTTTHVLHIRIDVWWLLKMGGGYDDVYTIT